MTRPVGSLGRKNVLLGGSRWPTRTRDSNRIISSGGRRKAAWHVPFAMLLSNTSRSAIYSTSGWFGTSNHRINFMLVSDNLFWFTSVIAIVVGHIIAIFLSHSIALRVIVSHNYAFRSQVPMIILMVAYTIASLWILTQPMYS